MTTPRPTATKTRSPFRMDCTITTTIAASTDKIWSLLTDAAAFPSWNSTVTSIEGQIAEGQNPDDPFRPIGLAEQRADVGRGVDVPSARADNREAVEIIDAQWLDRAVGARPHAAFGRYLDAARRIETDSAAKDGTRAPSRRSGRSGRRRGAWTSDGPFAVTLRDRVGTGKAEHPRGAARPCGTSSLLAGGVCAHRAGAGTAAGMTNVSLCLAGASLVVLGDAVSPMNAPVSSFDGTLERVAVPR
jgi:hypothetical protein